MNKGKLLITLPDGTTLELDASNVKDARISKSIAKRVDEQEEERLAEFVTSANEKLITSMRDAYLALSEPEKLAMVKRGFVARFGVNKVSEASVYQSSLIQIRKRAVRSDAGSTRSE